MLKHLRNILITLGLFMIFSCFSIEAAPILKELERNTTYKKYDITGDGKADTIFYSRTNNGLYKMSININGKKQTDTESSRGGRLFYCQFSKKKEFLIEDIHYMGGFDDLYLYKWKNGKLINVYANENSYGVFFSGYNVSIKLSKDKSKVNIVSGYKHGYKSFPGVDSGVALLFGYKYKPTSNGLKLTSNIAYVVGKPSFKAQQKVYTSKEPGGSKNGLVIKKGQKVKITKTTEVNGHTYFYAENKKGGGWFVDSTENILK